MTVYAATFHPPPLPDIEDLGDEDASLSEDLDELLPPLVRFKKLKLSVTDLSAQMWCETKTHFHLVTGFREESLAMTAGIARHAELEAQDHEVVEVEVETAVDLMGTKLLNTVTMLNDLLHRNRKVREVWIAMYTDITECVLRGVIDELCFEQNRLVLKDTKTRRTPTTPSPAQKRTSAIQLQTYMWMLDYIREREFDYDSFFRIYKLQGSSQFTAPHLANEGSLFDVTRRYVEALRRLPPLASYAIVEYDAEGVVFHQEHIPYKTNVVEYSLRNMMSFWWSVNDDNMTGVPIVEKWKCRKCAFIENCTKTPLLVEEKEAAVEDRRQRTLLGQDLDQIV